jgi:hypothetical protein
MNRGSKPERSTDGVCKSLRPQSGQSILGGVQGAGLRRPRGALRGPSRTMIRGESPPHSQARREFGARHDHPVLVGANYSAKSDRARVSRFLPHCGLDQFVLLAPQPLQDLFIALTRAPILTSPLGVGDLVTSRRSASRLLHGGQISTSYPLLQTSVMNSLRITRMTERFPCRACYRKLETNFYSLSFRRIWPRGSRRRPGQPLRSHLDLRRGPIRHERCSDRLHVLFLRASITLR